jgi:predicted ATP-grasp superfamily ATP-dependent carboligase
VKPRASGGGHGIRPWRPGAPLQRGQFLQERVVGVPGSVVFAADGARAVPLGVSRQLVGERAFGAAGFRYCGSILAGNEPPFGGALCDAAGTLAQAVTEEFGLVGVNGIDFVVRAGVPVPVEVNPRYTASMELVERAYGLCVFAVHARACAGALPAFDLMRARRRARGAVGKAIVYARRGVRPAGTERWLGDASVADVPRPGERIRRGRPVCTVFAAGPDVAACRAALERRAAQVYREIEPASRSAA